LKTYVLIGHVQSASDDKMWTVIVMPEHILAEPDIGVFRKLLKTHLFNLALNV